YVVQVLMSSNLLGSFCRAASWQEPLPQQPEWCAGCPLPQPADWGRPCPWGSCVVVQFDVASEFFGDFDFLRARVQLDGHWPLRLGRCWLSSGGLDTNNRAYYLCAF